jgi:hypothetical protein
MMNKNTGGEKNERSSTTESKLEWGRGGYKERVKEGEYVGNTVCACMRMGK